LEFYGGEPFLVQEHVRIFEILARLNARCTIYVNTNAVSLHPKAKRFLETLNFKTVAVSMDAVDPELHAEIRTGLRSDLFFDNIDYLLDLSRRKGLVVMLNVTEHRKNWFQLPEVFRFAEEKHVYLHINTCIHPYNVTLYSLPTDQLRYVLTFLEEERALLIDQYPRMSNVASYDFLLTLIRGELESRGADWKPPGGPLNLASDGHLAAPRPGVAPFAAPARVAREAQRIARTLDNRTAVRMLKEMSARAKALSGAARWDGVVRGMQNLASDLTGARARDAAPAAFLQPVDPSVLFRQQPWRTAPIATDDPSFPPGYLQPVQAKMLYHLGRDCFRGHGVIVDCGSFLGKSAALLAQGVLDNGRVRPGLSTPVVHAFDWFRVCDQSDARFVKDVTGLTVQVGDRIRTLFERQTAKWSNFIQVHEGDFLDSSWFDGEIEILFIDICKTPELNASVLKTMFPALSARSIVVQQDYHHAHHPTIHLSLELLADCIRPLATRVDDSFVFQVRAPIPGDLLAAAADVRSLPANRQIELMDSAISRLPDDERCFLRLARAILLTELCGTDAGVAELRGLPDTVSAGDTAKWRHELAAVRSRIGA